MNGVNKKGGASGTQRSASDNLWSQALGSPSLGYQPVRSGDNNAPLTPNECQILRDQTRYQLLEVVNLQRNGLKESAIPAKNALRSTAVTLQVALKRVDRNARPHAHLSKLLGIVNAKTAQLEEAISLAAQLKASGRMLQAGSTDHSQKTKDASSKATRTDDFAPINVTGISWDRIIGMEEEKAEFRAAIEDPLKWPQTFGKGEFGPWRGVLLYGPPGTGKTLLAKAAAAQCNASFFYVKGSDIMKPYVGTSEKSVRDLFAKAGEQERSIIFIDEIDAMIGQRDGHENDASLRVKTEFLTKMDGFDAPANVMVIGATNLPEQLDAAFKRRFGKKVLIPKPKYDTRLKMFQKMLGDEGIDPANFPKWARATEGCTGADIAIVVRKANMLACRPFAKAEYVRAEGGGVIPCGPNEGGIKVPEDTSALGDIKVLIRVSHVEEALAALAKKVKSVG